MPNNDLYGLFIDKLEKKMPRKTDLANYIAEILSIEKETAYRRLRGVTLFTFNEVAILARKFNLSLDELIIDAEKGSYISNMMIKSYYEKEKQEKEGGQQSTFVFIRQLVSEPYSEFGLALKSIPYPLLYSYEHISRYYKYKYLQHAKNLSAPIFFRNVELDDDILETTEESSSLFQRFSMTTYVWDKKIIPIIVGDILYFRSLNLMDDEDVKKLKGELMRFVKMLESMTTKGVHELTGNKIDFYISDEDIDSTYGYYWSENLCSSMLITHFSYMVISMNNKAKLKEMKDWVTSMTLNSTLISRSGGKERIQFMNEQREAIGRL